MRILLAGVLFLSFSGAALGQAIVTNINPSMWVGINQSLPSTPSVLLRCRQNASSAKQALIYMDIFGTGPGQVPPGSTIHTATLRLYATSTGGGDAQVFRAAEYWDFASTWNDLGNVATVGASKGAGVSSGSFVDISVEDHLALWDSGTYNDGWVIKGAVTDTTDTEFGNGSSGTAPRLQISYTPPDTTPPAVRNVVIRRSSATYTVPVGSGQQIKTIPLASVTAIDVTFSEDVSIGASNVAVTSAISGSYSVSSVSSLGSSTYRINLSSPISAKDKVLLSVLATTQDAAGNALDGDWSNPAAVGSTGTDTYDSGNGTAGGNFVFRFTLLPADFNQDNAVDGADFLIWQVNFGLSGRTFNQGDANGDGVCDSSDLSIWSTNFGTAFTTW